MTSTQSDDLIRKFENKSAVIGVIGLGYVGIPLCLAATAVGFKVIGFDIDEARVAQINAGESIIKHISPESIASVIDSGKLEATADFARLAEPDALLIAVPTPLTRYREPDLSFVEATAKSIAKVLRKDQLVVLESTTYPGTTDQVLRPILESSGLRCGEEFYLAYSPEREDPGNESFNTASIPKVVGGVGETAAAVASALYEQMIDQVVNVSSADTAEAVKLTENIYRAVNIALVNELKVVYGAMGIDVWEVIDAAKTKPFGFTAFYPGPGLGGHCIPIDPFYLTWKAREFDISTRFIELAGQINTRMPYLVVDRLAEALDRQSKRLVSEAKILMLGIAYKKNVDDMRESPSLKLIELLEERGAQVEYHDPFIPTIPMTREHADLAGRKSVALDAESIAGFDAVLIATDHGNIDYALISMNAGLIVDTRNVIDNLGLKNTNTVKA